MSKIGKEFRPTRTCPHPWCRPLHRVWLAAGVIGMVPLLRAGWLYLLFIALLAVMQHYVLKALRGGKSDLDLAMEDAVADEMGSPVQRIVRPGWARAAVAGDVFFVSLMLLGGAEYFSGHQEKPTVPTASAGGFMVVLISLALVSFVPFAHWMATQPVKPKRVRQVVPVSS